MKFWTPEILRSAAGGSWIVRPPQIELPKDRPADLPLPPLHAPITGLGTDTRTLKQGQAFLALRGERFDGHAYLNDAVAAGAPILIVDDESGVPENGFQPAVGVMKVADTGKALQRIAAAYRKTLELTRVIAVCGSNGKTTTANLIRQVLTTCGLRGTASPKSFNNAVGVPLTILSAQTTDQFLVCEVGTNAPGEIALLAEIVNPDIAVITSIGREHLEGLGDLAGVAREEASVLKHLKPPPKGCAIVTADSPELAEHLKTVPGLVTFGRNEQANFRLTAVRHAIDGDSLGVEFTINGRINGRVGLIGEHNALNALAALAVARRMGVDDQRAVQALAAATGPEGRLQRIVLGGAGGVEVLHDAYNANPDSMIAGIRAVTAVAKDRAEPPRRVVVVLADMLELGAASAASHAEVGRGIAEIGGKGSDAPIALAVLFGPEMAAAHRALLESGWPPSAAAHVARTDDAAASKIAAMIQPGDLVLLKGSRRMRLERVLESLRGRFPVPGRAGVTEVKGAVAMTG